MTTTVRQSNRRTTCRLCESANVRVVLELAPTPIADDYLPAARKDDPQPVFPLDLQLCLDCGHCQLADVVNPDLLYRNYTYRTSVSLGLTEHFRQYAADVTSQYAVAPGALAVDIGSNDGTLLRFFQGHGLRVVGVDPAVAIAESATAAGIPTLPTYFTAETSAEIRAKYGPATVVTANNVFAHADDLVGMSVAIRDLLADDGIFTFEVSYLVDIVNRQLFDTVYHEHLSYHTIKPLAACFARIGLQLIDAQSIATKGGSFRGVVQRAGGPKPSAPIVQELIAREIAEGYDRPELYEQFDATLRRTRAELLALVDRLRAAGKSVVGYGASATVTTLSHYMDLGGRMDYVVDDNPGKHGTFTPGHRLPVLPSTALYERRPDAVVILAWAYAKPIMAKHREYLAQGGRFVLPLPQATLVPPDAE